MKNKQDSRFLAISYDLLNAVGFIDSEGNQVELTLTDKLIYAHMKSRFDYFKIEKKSDYYDTQEAIADQLNIDRTTVVRRLKRLVASGAVVGFKKKHKNYHNWNYTSIPKLKLYKFIDGRVVVYSEGDTVNKIAKPKAQPSKAVQAVKQPMYFDDESDLPF